MQRELLMLMLFSAGREPLHDRIGYQPGMLIMGINEILLDRVDDMLA